MGSTLRSHRLTELTHWTNVGSERSVQIGRHFSQNRLFGHTKKRPKTRAKSNIVKNFVVRNDEKVARRINATSLKVARSGLELGLVGRDRL